MKVKIGELAKMTGCQVVTIRYYEKEGLLKRPNGTIVSTGRRTWRGCASSGIAASTA